MALTLNQFKTNEVIEKMKGQKTRGVTTLYNPLLDVVKEDEFDQDEYIPVDLVEHIMDEQLDKKYAHVYPEKSTKHKPKKVRFGTAVIYEASQYIDLRIKKNWL